MGDRDNKGGHEAMSDKIKRYGPYYFSHSTGDMIDGFMFAESGGEALCCSDLIPGTKVTNLEWCEHATDILKMYMPDDMGPELPDAPDVAALLSEIDKITTDRNNLLVQVQESQDKLKAAKAWKERAIDFMSHEEDDCLLEMMCPKWPLPDPGIDCRPCVEAYFAEDKP
jgi:hypothetical protein